MELVAMNAQAIISAYAKKLIPSVNSLLQEWNKYAKEISPVDEGLYIRSNKIVKAVLFGNKIVWTLYNDAPYARIIEDWVKGKVYNYHKWPPRDKTTRIYSGVGNRTYTRTRDFMQFSISKKP